MINVKQLFKTYNLKTWKQAKFQIALSIIAIAIAVAILVSLRLMLSLNNSYTNINAKIANDGDINIALINPNITDENLNVLKKLTSEGKIQYTTTYKMQNNFASGDITSVIDVKFVDSKYFYINKKISTYTEKLGDHKVLINKAAADKFKLKKGDTISLAFKGISTIDKKFIVEDIIESTNIIDESLLGVIILDKSNLQSDKVIKRENFATNINVIINKKYSLEDIKSQLKKSFNNMGYITTYEQAIEGTKNITKLESKALEFIEIIVVIITGVGISFTTLLLILKRKKDYVLLSIYGMKENLIRDLILYETFIICVIGIIIGVSISFMITGTIEKTIIREMDINTLIKVSIFPLVSTLAFIIVQTMIFTIVPIAMGKGLKPNSILRQEMGKISFNRDYISSIFKMIMLLALSFSIYIGSLKTGFMYICIILILIAVLYGLAIGFISLIVKMKIRKAKFLMLALRNMQRQKSKFASCATALITTLIICGLIINLGYSIIPNIMKQFVDDNGYNLSLTTDFNKENINNTEEVLSKEKFIENYIKIIKSTAKVTSIQGKSLVEFIKHERFNEEQASLIEESFNNISVEAIDISKDMLNYEIVAGKWFSSKDVSKNYIVLGNNFSYSGINIDDEIAFDIQGETFKFTILGICPRSNFRENTGIYIDINSFKDKDFINDSNSKLQYLIKCDIKNEPKLTTNLTKNLKNSLLINARVMFEEVGKYILQLTNVFIYICCISLFSALCLIGNILMIINYERLKEFLVLNVLGAKNKDIRKITIIEGLIIGSISGIVGSLISDYLSYSIITKVFECKYSSNSTVDLVMIIVAIVLTTGASLLVINNMKIEKYNELLREN